MASKFYVVWVGKEPGIYTDWAACKRQVDKFPAAKYKSFPTRDVAAAAYAAGHGASYGAGSSGATKSEQGAPKSGRSRKSPATLSAVEVDALPAVVKIFTDGGCEPNPGNAGSGVAVYRNGDIESLWYGLFNPNGTNNTAELNALHQAILMAQTELEAGHTVAIFCDSKYSIQCVTQWAAGWAKNNWTRKSGEIKNLAIIQAAYKSYQLVQDQLQVLHVNGHVGVEGNELADRMSIQAMQTQEPAFVVYADVIDVANILATRSG